MISRKGMATTLALVCAAALVACGAAFQFTPRPASYDLHCGDESCDPDTYECTTAKPVRCKYVGPSSVARRDAGAP